MHPQGVLGNFCDVGDLKVKVILLKLVIIDLQITGIVKVLNYQLLKLLDYKITNN